MSSAESRLKRAAIGCISVLVLVLLGSVTTVSFSSGVPADWIDVSAGRGFHLMAPAGTELRPAEGTDTFAGSFEAPDFRLSFDYGPYSSSLDEMSGESDYETRDVVVDGKAAKIVTAYTVRFTADRPYFIGIHFPEIEKTTLGATRLTVFGLFESADRFPMVENIFRTIQFD